jgi:hypothetical protein
VVVEDGLKATASSRVGVIEVRPAMSSSVRRARTRSSRSGCPASRTRAEYFESKQRDLALSMNASNVRYRSPRSAFEGKRICDSPEGINGDVAGPKGDGDFHHGDKNTQLCWWFTGETCLTGSDKSGLIM